VVDEWAWVEATWGEGEYIACHSGPRTCDPTQGLELTVLMQS